MPDKSPIVITAIMAFLTSVLGVFGRVYFVRKSQIFEKDGTPIYQKASGCTEFRRYCVTEQKDAIKDMEKRTCAKMDTLKEGQASVWQELRSLSNKSHEMSESIVRIETWLERYAERRRTEGDN